MRYTRLQKVLTKTRKRKEMKPTEKTAFEILEKNWSFNAYANEKKEREDLEKAKEMIRYYLKWINENPNTAIDVEKDSKLRLAEYQ